MAWETPLVWFLLAIFKGLGCFLLVLWPIESLESLRMLQPPLKHWLAKLNLQPPVPSPSPLTSHGVSCSILCFWLVDLTDCDGGHSGIPGLGNLQQEGLRLL